MADYQAHLAELESEGIDVVAASVDPLEDARKIVEDNGLAFPVAYGLRAKEAATAFGSFYAEDDALPYLHPVDFMIKPDGTIFSATYSTAPIGRLEAGDVLRMYRIGKKLGMF